MSAEVIELRALTVRQPWASCIAAPGGKRVENRGRRVAYRGRIAIHAGQGVDRDALDLPHVRRCLGTPAGAALPALPAGVIIAVATVSGCHNDEAGCCPPWGHAGEWHWELDAVRLLPEPVAVRGALGLWRLPADVAIQVDVQQAV